MTWRGIPRSMFTRNQLFRFCFLFFFLKLPFEGNGFVDGLVMFVCSFAVCRGCNGWRVTTAYLELAG